MTTANFNYNGIEYMRTEKGYFYKVENGKKIRIKQAEYEQAFENLTDDAAEDDDDVELEEFTKMIEDRKQAQAESDKQAEDAVNGKTKKPRKSKDIAHESNGVTLTAKQVDFIKHIPDTNFYEHGLDSALWCDILADEIGGQFAGKPMTVGAMISTLKEKNLISVGQERINGKKAKFFEFTELGKQVAKELGLN